MNDTMVHVGTAEFYFSIVFPKTAEFFFEFPQNFYNLFINIQYQLRIFKNVFFVHFYWPYWSPHTITFK